MAHSVEPKVELLAHTGGELIAALGAKLCYSDATIQDLLDTLKPQMDGCNQGADTKREADKFLSMISQMGHHSVFEHVSFSFGIEGVSRALTHQLVRHRLASYSQKSQRYVGHGDGFDYVTPPSIASNSDASALFNEIMADIAKGYDKLASMGVLAEDARYLLPNACETKIIVTMNARELLHFFKVRTCERAQWEIRKMAIMMLKLVQPIAPSIFKNAGPSCVKGDCTEGKMSCGKAVQIRQYFKSLSSDN